MNKNITISIIVPIYNVEKYLSKCLDSLINQTFEDIEIWAISDGSPDNSVDIIKKYAIKDDRVKCIEKENGGYGSVLEYAIKNINTEYFLICDPDDWLREDAIEVLYNSAKKYDLDFVYGAYYKVFSNDMSEHYASGIICENAYKPIPNKVITEDIDKMWFLAASPHSKLYKTKLAKKIKFPHKVSFTDLVLYTMYLPNVKAAMYIDEGLSYYLLDRPGNSVTDINPRVVDYYYTVYNSIMVQSKNAKRLEDYFYYVMFLRIRDCSISMTRIKNKNEFNEKKKIMYEIFEDLSKYRKSIYKYINKNYYSESKKRVLAYKLLLSPITSKMTFNFLMNKTYNDQVR